VTLTSHCTERGRAPDPVVRYDFVYEGDKWKINGIRSAVDGKPWSICALLTQYLTDLEKAG
jgi:hypothetical protein